MDMLQEFVGETPSALRVTGGMTKSKSFCRTLSNVTAMRVHVSSEVEGTILGAAMCAMVGSGIYASYEEAAREAAHTGMTVDPDDSASKNYAEVKQRWKELYLEITRLTEEGKL
jgi:autoinducer 2 (AI-2) kinase